MAKRITHGVRQTPTGFLVELYDVLEGFAVAVHLVSDRGTPKVAEVRVFPVATPPTLDSKAAVSFRKARQEHFGRWSPDDSPRTKPLKAREFRDWVKLGDLEQRARAAIAQTSSVDPTTGTLRYLGDEFAGRPETPADDLVASIAKRPTERNNLYYATLAKWYVDAYNDGYGREIYVVMAERHGYAPSTLRAEIKEARRRQMLTKPPTRGRAGGRLTAKAERILRQAGEAAK